MLVKLIWCARTQRSGRQPVKVISVTIGEARVRLHKTRFQLILTVPNQNPPKFKVVIKW